MILHRDIKPDNVFLNQNGCVKLAEFDVAAVLKSRDAKEDVSIGTPEYMSPEVLSSKPYNAKIDIWALGVLLYKMAMLRQPFTADSIPDLRDIVLNCKFPPLEGPYSQGFKNIVQMCLQKNPTARPDIKGLLNMPLINRQINKILNETLYYQDFAAKAFKNEKINYVARATLQEK